MSKKVIDVSVHQGVIDWEMVKPNIDGAILRCGYGSDREDQDDKQYKRNLKEVERLGIPYGVYLYSYASGTGAIQSEINHVLRLIRGHNPKIGVFIDLEENANGGIARIVAETFCRAINAAGYKAGVYTGAYYYKQFLKGVHQNVQALWWIAGYGTNSGSPEEKYKPDPGFQYDAWQYTSKATIPGILGGVDCSDWWTDWEPVHIKYRAHVQKDGWLPAVQDGEIAGTTGQSKRLEAIKITPPEGMILKVEAHIQKDGWKTYTGIKAGKSSGTGSSKTDPIIGTVGESKRLEAIKITATKNTTGKALRYQVHVQSYGWMDPAKDGEVTGTVGKAKRIEAIRIWLE